MKSFKHHLEDNPLLKYLPHLADILRTKLWRESTQNNSLFPSTVDYVAVLATRCTSSL